MNAKDKTVRIAVVDDDGLMRRSVVRLLLTEPTFEVVGEAANGREAVALARELCPRVVIMDVRMPIMDGFEATRMICAERPETVVIGFSAYCGEGQDIRGQMLKAGASDFVQKIEVGEWLLSSIHRHVGVP